MTSAFEKRKSFIVRTRGKETEARVSNLSSWSRIWGIFLVVRGVSDLESESEVAQSCPTLCDPMDCSLPGFSAHEIFQARVLKWVAISFSRRSSRSRDQT